jgi:hypothetical protein
MSDGDYNILRGNGNANNYFGAGWFGHKGIVSEIMKVDIMKRCHM